MCQRKAWSQEEDQLLRRIMQEAGQNQRERKLKWNDIAARISTLGSKTLRKGKQCRERWFNQLHPSIVKEQTWQPQQEIRLFQLQDKFGNHWAKISKGLPGRSDNSIKNYFYSCLRKALRKVNNYVYNNKRDLQYKNIKAFQKSTLSKILSVAENKAQNKISISNQDAPLLARGIKKLLVDIQVFKRDQEIETLSEDMKEIVGKILEFNRVCKRKKTKKKTSKNNNSCYPHTGSEQEESSGQGFEGIQDENQLNEQVELTSNRLQLNFQITKKQKIKSQHLTESKEDVCYKFSTLASLDESKKMKNQVLIPSCSYNRSSIIEIQHSQSLKTIDLSCSSPHPTSLNQQYSSRTSFVPCLPMFQAIYRNSLMSRPIQRSANSPSESSRVVQKYVSHFASSSSFHICPQWGSLKSSNPFSSAKNKEQQTS